MKHNYFWLRKVFSSFLVVLAFGGVIVVLVLGLGVVLHAFSIRLHSGTNEEGPLSIVSTYLTLLLVLFATFFTGLVRRTSVLNFGLRDGAWISKAAAGSVSGILAFAALTGLLAWKGGLVFTPNTQSIMASVGYGALWAIGYTGTALLEENMFRGVPLAELSRALGFPIAAILTSAIFGFIHLSNGDENLLAAINAVILALVLAASVKLTGSLWWAIGFHAAWDWVESFVAGAPDSGIIAQGRLLKMAHTGSEWLSGGAAGPEGSVFMLIAALVALGALLASCRLQKSAAT